MRIHITYNRDGQKCDIMINTPLLPKDGTVSPNDFISLERYITRLERKPCRILTYDIMGEL